MGLFVTSWRPGAGLTAIPAYDRIHPQCPARPVHAANVSTRREGHDWIIEANV